MKTTRRTRPVNGPTTDDKPVQRDAGLQQAERDALTAMRDALALAQQQRDTLDSQLREAQLRNDRQLETLLAEQTQRAAIESRLAERETALSTIEQRCAWLAVELDNLPELDARILTLQREADETAADLAARVSQIADMEARIAQQKSRVAEHTHQVPDTDTRETQLRLEIEAKLRHEIEALSTESAERNETMNRRIAEYETRLAELADAATRVDALNGELAGQRELSQSMETLAAVAAERAQTLNEDLRTAEEQLHANQASLRSKDARLDELLHSIDALQGELTNAARLLEERDLRLLNLVAGAGSGGSMLGGIQQSIKQLRRDEKSTKRPARVDVVSHGNVARMLVSTEGESEVVHVLGRKNRIGRTPDNDIQIDADCVSRHHAVILTSQRHTIVEDLNSTNGVAVNGVRVTSRRPLANGDVVKIGKAKFRFVSKQSDTAATRAQA